MIPLFQQGAFTAGPNDTPETIAQKRAYIASMMPRFGSARYVGEGLGQLATGVVIGRQNRKLNEAEGAGRKSADDLFSRLFGTANSAQSSGVQGPLSVLGMAPEGPPLPPPDPNSPHALGDAAMAALGKPKMETGADPASIKAGLVARGMPEHIADGFVMNFVDESGLNPGINEANPVVPGSRGGFGLYQLTGPRRRAYEAYAAERGIPLDSVDGQLDFLMTELQGPEAAAWAKISGTQNAGEAAAAIVNSFLRPAEEHRASREAEYLGGGAPAPQSGIPMAELQMALQNPWLSGDQKALIAGMIEQQTQAADPMRAIELEKAQLELEALRNPAADPMAAIELEKAEIELARLKNPETEIPKTQAERMALAAEGGLQPGTPEYQNYILTGELATPAGGSEYGLTPVLGRDRDGNVVVMQLGKDGTAVETQMPDGVTADLGLAAEVRAEGAAVGKAKGEDEALLSSTSSKMAGLEQVVSELDALADQATYTIIGQGVDWLRKEFGAEPRDAAVARTDYIAKVDNQVLPMLRDTFGAAFTVREGETLRATLGDPNKTPAEKKAVLRAFIEQKKRDVEALERRTGKSGDGGGAPTSGDTGLTEDDLKYLE